MEFLQKFPGPPGMKTVCALGNFDGVHLGHGKIIAALKKEAEKRGARSCAVTFDPHPQKVLGKKSAHLLLPFAERLRLLGESGLETVVRLEFDRELSLMSPERFIREVMVEKAGMKAMVVGPRFGFGNKREGNVGTLRTLGEKFGFETVVVEPARVGGARVSSSAIRDLVLSGRTEAASKMLGYRYYVKGTVEAGEKRGREIGFPTVNLKTPWEILPKPGVYATMTAAGGGLRKSITNIGHRPTFGGGKTVVESHLLDTDGDFYGKTATVEFVKRVRDEKKFGSARELSARIAEDVEFVRSVLKNEGAGGQSP